MFMNAVRIVFVILVIDKVILRNRLAKNILHCLSVLLCFFAFIALFGTDQI